MKTWLDYYAMLDVVRTTQMHGDFARGQRDRKSTVVLLGTFARGQRALGPQVLRRARAEPPT